jgi:hypothetical protein
MRIITCVLPLFVMLVQAAGEVDSTVDKKVDFSAFRTYAWERGQEAYDRATHKMIVEAIDAEMVSLGFTKAEAAKTDVVIKYHTVRAADVDLDVLKQRQKEGRTDPAPTSILGILKVEMRAPGRQDPIWEARTRGELSDVKATRDQEIRRVVAALFKTYPRGKKKES